MNSQTHLPLIIGFGGINCAGRSSANHAYRRLVLDKLSEQHRNETIASLAGLTGLEPSKALLDTSLVRALSPAWFAKHKLHPDDVESHAAGSLPDGFNPSMLYSSRYHPRGLQMGLFAINDCLGSMGFDWKQILTLVNPEKIAVYASSSMGQLDEYGLGGLLQSRVRHQHPTTKQIPFSYPQAIADMINAYVIGNLGTTGCNLGACAGFLYNLANLVHDIQSGRAEIGIVGVSDMPLVPEVIEAFTRMGALASNRKITKMQGKTLGTTPDFSTACRPFGDNCGFVLAESSQFLVLATPQLAMTLGAQVFGAVSDVCINADGFKQSISSPGVGNYLSVARAAASLRALLGEDSLQNRSVVQSHGTGTPVNRVTESDIYARIAGAMAIPKWPILATKGRTGHAQAAASADQIILSLGIWQHHILPGIEVTPQLGDNVITDGLDFCLVNREIEPNSIDAILINAKGFGGNNATAVLLAPEVAKRSLVHLFGEKGFKNWVKRSEVHATNASDFDTNASRGQQSFRYLFNYQVLEGSDVHIGNSQVQITGYPDCVLPTTHPFAHLLKKI